MKSLWLQEVTNESMMMRSAEGARLAVSLKEQQFFKDLPQCSQRSGTSPTAQPLAGSDVTSPSVCYDLQYNVKGKGS